MPIIDLQRRLNEVGRLRMGTSRRGQRGGKLPVRLETWRATSADEERLKAMAELYGGEVKPWPEREGHFDLITEQAQLPVLLIPGHGFSQWWELWTKPVAAKENAPGAPSTCVRRCDGRTEQISGGTCMCPSGYDERKELSQDFQACSPHTRLSVMLPEVPGIGLWRLESTGYYAAVELAGAVSLLEEATRRGMFFAAVLRIDWRRGVAGDGQRTTFPVPVVDIAVRAPEVFQIAGAESATLVTDALSPGELPPPTYTPIPADESGGVSLRAGLEAVSVDSSPTRTARSAAPLGTAVPPPQPASSLSPEDVDEAPPSPGGGSDGEPETEPITAAAPSPEPETDMTDVHGKPIRAPAEPVVVEPNGPVVVEQTEPVVDPTRANVISDAQRRRLWAIVGAAGVPEDYVRHIVVEITGQDSTASITKDVYDAVVTCIQAWTPGEERE